MELTGKLKVIGEAVQVSDKFLKREFVITDNSTSYPQHISFQLSQNNTDLIDGYAEGDDLTVHFNLRGREWISPKGEAKYFNTLEVWRIEEVFDGAKKSAPAAENKPLAAQAEEDLPF